MNAYDEINIKLLEASKYIKNDVSDCTLEMITTPWREIVVSCPIKMDNGDTKVFSGYRIQHNAVRGPYKGGVRYHPDADQPLYVQRIMPEIKIIKEIHEKELVFISEVEEKY